jgi:hypothetical protein
MWDMRFAAVLGYLPMASILHLISHLTSSFEKRHSHSNMTTPTGRGFSQRNEEIPGENRVALFSDSGYIAFC